MSSLVLASVCCPRGYRPRAAIRHYPELAETWHSDERRIKRSGRGQQLLSYPEKGTLECGHHIGAQRAGPASGTADVTRFRGANTEHGCLAGGAVPPSQQPIKTSTIEVSLAGFDQRFAAFKAINDLRQQVFDPMQQLRPARVTESKPDHLRCLARMRHPPEGEVFILGHHHRVFSFRPLPNQTVGDGIQPKSTTCSAG